MYIRFKAIGAVSQVSPSLVEFPNDTLFAVIPQYLKQKIKLDNKIQLWCYVGNAFIPPMDDSLETIGGLTSSSSSKDEILVVTYSLVEAFG